MSRQTTHWSTHSLPKMRQVTARMDEYHLKTSESARKTSLWVTESLLCQVKAQRLKYACRCFESLSQLPRFALKRLPREGFYCVDCDSAAEKGRTSCQLHADGSPITRFSRIRYVQVRSAGNESYEIFCSCLFQPTYGIPCQHLVALMSAILPHHVSVRWHTDIAYNYQMTEDATSRFNSWKNEKRVLITWQELNDVIFNARRRQEMYARDLPETFWDNDCVKHQAGRGTISPVEEDDDGDPTFYPEDSYGDRNVTAAARV